MLTNLSHNHSVSMCCPTSIGHADWLSLYHLNFLVDTHSSHSLDRLSFCVHSVSQSALSIARSFSLAVCPSLYQSETHSVNVCCPPTHRRFCNDSFILRQPPRLAKNQESGCNKHVWCTGFNRDKCMHYPEWSVV